jgi:hypothetical protein
MADKIIILPQRPLHQNRHSFNRPPLTPTYLNDLTINTILSAQQHNIVRQNKLARVIEAAALASSSATEKQRLHAMWQKVTAKTIVPDDVLIDILADGGGGIDRVLLGRFLHILLRDLRESPDRCIRSLVDRSTAHTARVMKRVEVLLDRGFDDDKARLALSGDRRVALRPEEDEVYRERVETLACRIHVLHHYMQKTEDTAIELGSALAAWHALRGEVVERREVVGGALGPGSSSQVGAGVQQRDVDALLINGRSAQQGQAVLQGGPRTQLLLEFPPPPQRQQRQQQPVSPIVWQNNDPSSPNIWRHTWRPIQYSPPSVSPEPIQSSPAVSPKTQAPPPVVTEGRVPSPVQIHGGQGTRTHFVISIREGSNAEMEEERADRPVEAPSNGPPSPPAAPDSNPRDPPQGEEEAAFDMSEIAMEAFKLALKYRKRAVAASRDILEMEREEREEQEDEGEDEWGFIRRSLRASALERLEKEMLGDLS